MSSKPSSELPFSDESVASLPVQAPSPPTRHSGSNHRPARRARSMDRPVESSNSEVSEPGFRPAHLYVERGPGAGQLMPVRQGELSMGRASVSDLRLLHPSISRHHAQLTRRGERFFMRDLGSQNGTFVNRGRVTDEVEIRPGDQIALGHAMLRLRVNGPAEEESSIGSTLRSRWTLARWAVFAAAVASGFAGVSLWQVYRITSVPVVEVVTTAQPEPSLPVVPYIRNPVRSVRPIRIEAAASAEPRPQHPVTAEAPVHHLAVASPTRPVRRYRPPSLRTTPVRGKTITSHSLALGSAFPPASSASLKATLKMAAPPSKTSGPSNLLAELEPTDTMTARYEGGDAGGALELARRAGDSQSTQILTRFRKSYGDAQRSLAARDVPEAKRQFEAALELDGQLSHGRGWYHAEIKKHLSILNTLEGDRELALENLNGARQAYREAVTLNPGNRQARAKLDALTEDSFAAAPSKLHTTKADNRSSAIDEAFEKE